MKNKLLSYGTILTGFLVPHLLMSQQDVTAEYVINPSFEDDGTINNPTMPTGWIHTENNYVWCGVNGDGDPNTKDGENIFGIWNNAIGNFEIYQTIEDLPKGIYSVSCDIMCAANGNGTRMTTQRVFAGNDEIGYRSQYFGNKIDYATVNLAKDETYSFAGHKETMGDASALQTTRVILDFPGGDLKIGFRTNGTASAGYEFVNNNAGGMGWFKIDNFKLSVYNENELLDFHKSNLSDALNDLIVLDYSVFPFGYETLAGEILSKAEAIIRDSQDQEEVLAMIEEIKDVINIITASEPSWLKLNNLIILAKELVLADIDGTIELQSEYDNALAVFEGEESLVAEFNLAIESLEKVINNYRLNINASIENPADFTWKITAPHFTNEYQDISDESQRFMGTWKTDIVSNGGDFKLATSGYKNCWNSWSGNFTSMMVYQDLENLPEGLYSLSCETATDGIVSNQHAFAISLYGTAVSNPPSPENQVTGDFKYTAVWEKIETTTNILVGEDGKLRIGMRSEGGNGTSGWFCVTDFKLTYYGNEAALENYKDALNTVIVKAESLLEETMLLNDYAVLENAINSAKTAGENISEIKSSINNLIELTETTQENIKILVGFMSGALEDLLGFETDITSLQSVLLNTADDIEGRITSKETLINEIEEMTIQVNNLLDFASLVNSSINETIDEDYSNNIVAEFEETVNDIIIGIGNATIANIEKANNQLVKAIVELRRNKLEENKDVSVWIINPSFEDGMKGWVNNGMQTQSNSSFAEKTGTYYCEKWIGSGNLDDASIHQTIDLPYGEYIISLNASATQFGDPDIEGAFLAACDGNWNTENLIKTNISKQYITPVEYELDENGDPVDRKSVV